MPDVAHGYEFGPFRLDARGGVLYRDGNRLSLPPKAVDVLRALLAAAGEVVTRAELFETIWNDVTVEDSNLSKLVFLVRRELSDVPAYAEAIETVAKRGYRFLGEVREYRGDRHTPPGPVASPALEAPVRRARTTVAVVPLRMLTPSAEDPFPSLALTDALINRLVGNPTLEVRAAKTALPPAGQPLDPATVAERLEAEVVVEGSIQRLGGRLRVHLQVWENRGKSPARSLKEEGDFANLFPLEDRLSAGLAEMFRPPWEPKEQQAPAVMGPKNPVAYGLYLRAGECILHSDPWEGRQAVALLEQMLALEPDFAPGWARLSAACLFMGVYFDVDQADPWVRRSEEAARRALVLKPGDADAHCALARTLWTPSNGFQHRAAMASFTDALRLNPRCQPALAWKGGVLSHTGLLDEAAEVLEEALTLRADDAAAVAMQAQNSLHANRVEEAEEIFSRALHRNPSEFQVLLLRPVTSLYSNRLDRAEQEIQHSRQLGPDQPLINGHEALLWALRGEPGRARPFILRTLEGKVYLTTHHAWHYAAAAAATIDEKDLAMDLLQRASATGLPSYPTYRNDPFLARLVGFPRFQGWLDGLEQEWLAYRRDFA